MVATEGALGVAGAGVADKWRLWLDVAKLGDEVGRKFPGWPLVERLELEILTGSILEIEDVIAKLSVVARSFSDSPRADELDAAAIGQTIDWLKTRT